MLSRGYIGLALGKAAGPLIVRKMLVLIPEVYEQLISADIAGRLQSRSALRIFGSRCGGFLYSAFAETFRAFRGKDFTTRLRWLFDLL